MSCTVCEKRQERKRLLYAWGPGKVGLEAARVRKHDLVTRHEWTHSWAKGSLVSCVLSLVVHQVGPALEGSL